MHFCPDGGWYENPALRQRLTEADEILLASDWHYWQAELVPESVANLRKAFQKPVLVFGTKNFSEIRIRQLLATPVPTRYGARGMIDPQAAKTNRLMRDSLPGGAFVDVNDLLCKSESDCPLFTAQGELVSFDGAHLLPAGAKSYGEALAKHPLVQAVLVEGN